MCYRTIDSSFVEASEVGCNARNGGADSRCKMVADYLYLISLYPSELLSDALPLIR